jgi:acetyltransferase-like isoleucine patch superfamily enzyme
VLGRGVTVGAGAHVMDGSVVGDGVTIAPGAQLTDARVPEPA